MAKVKFMNKMIDQIKIVHPEYSPEETNLYLATLLYDRLTLEQKLRLRLDLDTLVKRRELELELE